MQKPDWLLPRPPFELTPEKLDAFEGLWQSTNCGESIDYHLPYPKWQFLTYLCETKEFVLHGSQHSHIDIVEPRQAHDTRSYSNQHAIYATTDGIWVIFFAIIDRKRHPGMSLFNSCLQIRISADQLSDPLYFFSISQPAKLQTAWCEGLVYILPRQRFERENAQVIQGAEVIFPHWISKETATPVAKLVVGPQDFPFLEQIHGHDDEKLNRLEAADPNGFPWQEALES